MSYNAYQKTQQSTENPTEVEYRLFATVTRALTASEQLTNENPEKIKALDWNRRMWSTFSSDCGVEGNGLPKELRASIISLSMWVSRHSSAVMRGEEQVSDLIQVNKTIMEGLRQQMQLLRNAGSGQDAAGTGSGSDSGSGPYTPATPATDSAAGSSTGTQDGSSNQPINPILQNFKSKSV